MSQVLQRLIAGRLLSFEVGKLAQQANGTTTIRYGNTLVLATACAGREPLERGDFLPLTVDYEERLYAAGKIPGSFFRREGRPNQEATVTSRLIDRTLRPLFPKGFNHEIQIIATVLSADKENDPDICALIAASAALTLSDIPFLGPVSAVHVGYIDGNFTLNPTLSQTENSLFDIVVASTKDAIVMVEAGAREAPESLVLEAIKFGHEANQEIIKFQEELCQIQGKPKMEIKPRETSSELLNQIASLFDSKLDGVLEQRGKLPRERALDSLREEIKQALGNSFAEDKIELAFESQLRVEVRRRILRTRKHIDSREACEIRPISSEVALLPCTHGSALFTRGETQILSVTTLGSVREEQALDGLGLEKSKRFMHHYNFPPFSTGEVKRIGTPGRREIGHGALVERAIIPILPLEENFPYTIRLVSEALSSHGSTSMGSVCASSLSLMDAGVPIKRPVAGIAMGLVTGEGGDYVILTDIEGMEDAYGDMDFKVAGTSQGITALQLDIKLKGVNEKILAEALEQARLARLEILGKMGQTISTSRSELSPYAPRMYEMTIDPNKIGSVIGPGGRTIRSIIDETKATIDVKSDGTIIIGSSTEEAAQKAIKIIEDLTREAKLGDIYTGKVTRLLNFGAMVEVLPGREGLVHISELADYHVAKVEDVVKVGDEIMVKVIEIDSQGRINLSRRAVLEGLSRLPGARVRDTLAPKYQGHNSRDAKP
ncbi:MAG: polyribonucleotide nucleotidyltransferase [Chloroflexi bacterium CG_4_9_14_3_um_filter_45_9]|nr:MAG: polyribonucleotide nucleotidyltransferase [Dehalococcoidia bacterium CG2_30_46_9]PIU23082.1 MAG: polyribonucleotide nucleotidyltransferase [Chloroflexi bacterium CG08_land_8_20_14_0_20_45_12]PIX27203.1 MAG: polyribonucleotide nucleotidyltransferase [Chloroflexi bacterium CG_4_8_14_3_um_filter_45_15]PJB50908.1 MAG: polyribonucleotide nucleotidyltransferase [Chloroflexi bacterium CG_4_9_14_3_um_filter_45_9]